MSSNIQFDNAVPFESVIKSISRGAPCNARQLDEMASENATKMQYLMLSNIQNGIIEDTLPYLSHIDGGSLAVPHPPAACIFPVFHTNCCSLHLFGGVFL